VVLWSPFVTFEQVAGLASTRTYALTSAFRPTYNMAANLVRRYRPDQAHHLLNLSFAQYRADAEVVRLETQLERSAGQAAVLRERAACELGDLEEYRRLLGPMVAAPGAGRLVGDGGGHGGGRGGPGPGAVRRADRDGIETALDALQPGDVLVVPGRPAGGRVAVVSTARRGGGELRLAVAATDASREVLTARDFHVGPRPVAHVELPVPYRPHSKAFLREVAARLRVARLRAPAGVPGPPDDGRSAADGTEGPADPVLARALAAAVHPVGACPALRQHLRAAERADRLEEEAQRLERTVRRHTDSLARQFDRVLRVLEDLGYVAGWALTPAGERLARLYHECDLLVVRALEEGLFDELDPAGVAGLVSTFTYEARGPAGTGPAARFPTRALRQRWGPVEALAAELNDLERRAGLPETRRPDPGFVALAHAWAAGGELGAVIADEEMSGGDFVRNIKQLVDLLRQLGDLAPVPATAAACRAAAEGIQRGVVLASSTVGTGA